MDWYNGSKGTISSDYAVTNGAVLDVPEFKVVNDLGTFGATLITSTPTL
jgi:hypothetical protein